MQKIQTEHGIFTNNEITGQTAEEVYAEYLKQIDICPKDRPKTNEELTEEQIKMQKIIADLEIDILNKE